jgi:hypothetical protein
VRLRRMRRRCPRRRLRRERWVMPAVLKAARDGYGRF